MPELTPEEQYQKEYDDAYAALDAAGAGKTAATTAEEAPKEAEASPQEPVKEEPKAEETPPVDQVEELRLKLEKAEKALKDTQAWGTKNAQRLAEIEKQRLLQQREASKPAILEERPELEEAIRYVTTDPTPQIQAQEQHSQWASIIDAAHPGIFQIPDDDELVVAIAARAKELGPDWNDPLIAIREISAQKLAHAERQIAKKYEAEAKARAQKSAMSVPGPGATTARTVADPDKEAADRIHKMTPAEFEKERRRVLGY
jgi:hypothetical protein